MPYRCPPVGTWTIKEQEQVLTNRFSQGISLFAKGAKQQIQEEIDRIAKSRFGESATANIQERVEPSLRVDIPSDDVSVGLTVPNDVPILGGFLFSFRVQHPLLEALKRVTSLPVDSNSSAQSKITDPYKIRVETKEEAQQIGRTINEFCAPHIQNWWVDTQDQLVREGSQIREKLVNKIQEDIQQISNELSDYLGEALHVDLNINPIQFPGFEFQGIDAQIQYQQEVYTRSIKETRRESRCCSSDKVYDVDVPFEDKRSVFEVDLHETARLITQKIDEQVSRNLGLLQRVIEKQVSADFSSAEKQINDYIKRFQDELDTLLKDRETMEAEADQIRAKLEAQKAALNKYLRELTSIRESLNTWKPM